MICDKIPKEKDKYELLAFKDILRELRIEKNLTQASLAHHLQYGSTAIANYESGRNEPKIKDLIKLADFFEVSLDYLIRKEIMIASPNAEEQMQLINNYMRLTNEEKVFVQYTIAFFLKNAQKSSK